LDTIHFSLLERIAEKDQQAFKELFDHFRNKVFNTVISYLQHQEEAEEITHDVFIEVFHSARYFNRQSSVSTWIYRIAVNKSLDQLRHRNRKKRSGFLVSLFLPDSTEAIPELSTFEHPGVQLENKEKSKLLFSALRVLPERQKTAFILQHIEGLSGREVSEIMNLSPKAVESLTQRAKINLRMQLEKFYPERGKNRKESSIPVKE